jgi:hypothetical protein
MGATCAVQTATGSFVVVSPASVEVMRGPASITVSCSKGEHYRGEQVVNARPMMGGWYTYPACVTVPMTLYTPSLKPKYKVLPHD